MAVMTAPTLLRTLRAGELETPPAETEWLIHTLWAKDAVGILGGAPKLGKSWFGLEMAVSVASGTPCFGRFAVETKGRALLYLAEDPLTAVRTRLEALCLHRGLEVAALELFVIDEPALRLDVERDRARLEATIAQLRPKLLVLDPLVRLHALDENSAHDVSQLLGKLTELQRKYSCAIVLVHHASKRSAARPGEALRGSTDLHAWGASNAYLTRQGDKTVLTLEHRAARAPAPIVLELISRPDGTATHFEIVGQGAEVVRPAMEDRVLELLQRATTPLPREQIRIHLRVNNQRLGLVLAELERQGKLERVADGWRLQA